MLLSLPVDVICEGVLPNLSIRDLQILDTAFTNKDLRPQLRNIWKFYRFSYVIDCLRLDYIKWLNMSDIKIVSLRIQVTEETYEDYMSLFSISMPALQQIYIGGASQSIDDLLELLAQSCPQLQVVHLPSGETCTDIGIQALAQHCFALTTISLSCNEVTDAGIQALCDNCPQLQHINISCCFVVTDTSLIAIANTYPHLLSFELDNCEFTDDALIFFANKCHELRFISISGEYFTSNSLAALWRANPKLTVVEMLDFRDDCFLLLANLCPQLQVLRTFWCCITDAAIMAVAEHCPQLSILEIRESPNISDAALFSLGQHCHQLKLVDLVDTAVTSVGIAEFEAFHCDTIVFGCNFS